VNRVNLAYVYAILVDDVIRYIGKGRKGRAELHTKLAKKINKQRSSGHKVRTTYFYNKLAKAMRENSNIVVRILKRGMTDEQAFAEEIQQIEFHTGLWNERAGGHGLSSMDAKALWKNNRRRMLIAVRDPKRLAIVSAIIIEHNKSARGRLSSAHNMREKWENPKFRAHTISGLVRHNTQPDVVSKIVERNRSPKMRAITSERNRSPAMRAAVRKKNLSFAFQAKASNGIRRRHELIKLANVSGMLGFGA
jgi:hypothetical protein